MLIKLRMKIPLEVREQHLQVYSHCNDENSRYLIVGLLKHLEPRALEEERIIFEPKTEVGEIIFFLNGRFEVGYCKESFENSSKVRNEALKKLK